jgi:hypothetical protein
VFPWSAWLGVASVPELPTAALALLAMAALVPVPEEARAEVGMRRLVGGAALLAATLSRYETWPVAGLFGMLCTLDLRRFPEARARILGAATLALAGPVLWLVNNRVAHHDALHFVARVTAYRQALGGAETSAFSRAVAYPTAFLREAPEVVAAAVVGATLVAAGGTRALKERLVPYARPAAILAAQVALLSFGMIKDGGPTHHPERAVLSAMLLVAVLCGALVCRALEPMPARRRAAVALGVSLAFGAASVARATAGADAFSQRRDEEAIGRAAATIGEGRLLIEAVDYGYLAVQAASGRPWDTIADRTMDPRQPVAASSFAEAGALAERMLAANARCAAGRVAEPVSAAMGAPRLVRGSWGLFCNEAAR